MKKKINWIKILLIAIIAVTFNEGLIAQNLDIINLEWKLIKTKKKDQGYQIFKGNVPSSKLNYYKVVGKVNCSIQEAQTAYMNQITDSTMRITKKGKSLGWVKVLERTDKELVTYDYMEGYFMTKPRDVIARYTIFEDSTTNVMGVKWTQIDWEGYEPSDSIVRMPVATGSWSFEKIDSANCVATGTFHFHPGGKIPTWLLNMVVKSSIPIELKHLRKSVSINK